MAILTNNGGSAVCIEAVEDARVLLIAGQPLNEPIALYGPCVMNTTEQIHQAMRDYQAGKFEATADGGSIVVNQRSQPSLNRQSSTGCIGSRALGDDWQLPGAGISLTAFGP